MSDVDDRIVSIEFDNSRFESRISDTIRSLDKLTETLQMTDAIQGLTDVADAANRFDVSHMADALDEISSKFSALGAIAFSVIQNITSRVLDFTAGTVSKILDPILQGGRTRAQNLEQARFMFEGIGLDVTKAMDSAKQAVLGTAFGLDEAAKVAAQFGASGIKAGAQMTGALRGVAGAAAMTGSSFSEIGDIFASSAAIGKVTNLDLQQFATRGLNAAAAIAPILHKTEAQVHEMATAGQLDFKTFADAMDKAFGKHATEANKTFAGSLANMRAALARIGASFFTPLLENERNVFNALTPAIDKVAKALTPLINLFAHAAKIRADSLVKFINGINFKPIEDGFKRLAFIIANIRAAIHAVLIPIRKAFHEVFPPTFTSTLVLVLNWFVKLTEKMIVSAHTADNIKAIFSGLFSIFRIGWTIIKELVKFVADLVDSLHISTDGFQKIAVAAGVWLTLLKDRLVVGGEIHQFFIKLREYIDRIPETFNKVEKKVDEFVGKVGDFFNKIEGFFKKDPIGDSADATVGKLGRVQDRLDTLGNIGDKIRPKLDKAFDAIANWFKELGSKLASAFSSGDFDQVVDLINVGLLGGIAVLLKKFLEGDLLNRIAPSFMEKVGGMFEQLTGTLKSMQQQVKADTLLKIAEAIGIITISLVALSLIDSKKLTQALLALTVGFGELIGAMTAMDKLVGSNASAIKLGILGAALIELATASLILVGAIAILAQLNWEELTRGLTGIAIGLGLLIAAAKILSSTGIFGAGGSAIAGAALLEMAIALNILAGAVVAFGKMNLDTLAKGLGAVAIGLGIMVAALKVLDAGPLGGAGAVLAGAGMVLIATALNILAGAVKLFALMSVGELVKGLIGVGAALVIIAGAMKLMPLTLPITAAGMILLSIAMNILAGALKIMASINLFDMVKSLTAMAIVLGILAVGMIALQGALPGAAALLVISVAMSTLASVMAKLAQIKLLDIVKALAVMAVTIGLFAGLSVLLSEAIVPMIGLGAGLLLIGAGFALLGGGLFLLGKGLEAVAKFGVAGAEALVKVMTTLGRGLLVAITNELKDLLNAVPLLIRLITAILDQLLETIIKLAPKLGKALVVLFKEGLKALRIIFPDLIQAGIDLLVALLEGIADNIERVVEAAVNVIVNFVNAIADNIDRVMSVALVLLIAFIQGIADNIQMIVDAGTDILTNLLLGITQDIIQVVNVIRSVIMAIISTIANDIQQIVDAGTDILINLLLGITNNVQRIIDTVTFIITTIITQLALNAILIANAGTNALVAFLGALADDAQRVIDAIGRLITTVITAVGNNATRITDAGTDALVKFLNGIAKDIPEIAQTAVKVITNFLNALGQAVGPIAEAGADLMINFLNGVANVIREKSDEMGKALANLAEAMAAGFRNALMAAITKMVKDLPGPLGEVSDTILHALGVESPSKLTYFAGEMLMLGLSKGITESINQPVTVAKKAGETVIDKMNDSLANLSNSLGDLGEFNPTITPVLDLTKVQLEATKIAGLMKVSAISPDISTANANQIASTAEFGASSASEVPVAPSEVKFEQNNYSPKALTVNDIYKNTKNQIALAKEELNI